MAGIGEIEIVRTSVCLRVCLRLPDYYVKYSLNSRSNKSYCRSVPLYTALAIDTVDGRGLSNEARRVLLPKKSKVMLYFPFITCTIKAV